MPRVVTDGGGGGSAVDTSFTVFGLPTPPPPPPTATPTLGRTPTVSSTPTPGQGIATDASGGLPASVAAKGLQMLAADPTAPLIGQCWYRTDTHQFCVQESGAVKRVTLA